MFDECADKIFSANQILIDKNEVIAVSDASTVVPAFCEKESLLLLPDVAD